MSKITNYLQLLMTKAKGYKSSRSNSKRFKAFYMSSKEDTRSDGAKIIDFSLIRIAFFMIFFLLINTYLYSLLASLAVTVIVISVGHYISLTIRNKKLEYLKGQKRFDIACKKVYKDILNKTIDELREFVEQLYKKLGFMNLKEIYKNNNIIIHEATYKNEAILVSFYAYKNEDFVEMKEIKETLSLLKKMKIKKNVLITTSDFTKDSWDFANLLSKKYRVLLIKKEQLLKLIENSNMFPTDEEIDEIIENTISRRRAGWRKYKNALLAKNKSKSYFLLSVFLILGAFYTPFSLYYMTVAGLSMGLTAITVISRVLNSKEKETDNYSLFNQLYNE
ncbi:restriction endonuclease [Alkaliphilus pronyensis]|uniref:Restriction endonuclease n=1 Tax=Alkaliphilus pronyensis TaxID=1482732 RepID=A0A6I0FJM5_9FIRM|nr:restriction endonuclease [Alkaliphilus pronyensis]KAB3538608.1 restriction endonuclease [Alkaliphilus pronyensis]